ncbi:glucose-6-phosphate dehydrogenase assembly protein OpcA [Gulosibacter bifidus]|uniref:Glucose-6-phosphate dehydrogenase assembly protein OpcA n=1 Tax=Gulosibacter bifidus TaxID=272239 RepID=A0ABW5RFP8_9MICO|nr:glucose-6-phosphate dehydrogenase assembly protein OpcA [Gulosibacter bifidus]
MIISLSETNSSEIAREIVRLREKGGAVALGRVLTLVVVAGQNENEEAINAANHASGEHPMRVIVVHTQLQEPESRLDAEIRVGSDAGASEVIVLHASGATAHDPAALVQPLLLPDAPIVTWWPEHSSLKPSETRLGKMAQLRITDTHFSEHAEATLVQLAEGYADGDTNLAWTRITRWRAQLAAVLDQPPYLPVLRAEVDYSAPSTSTLLMAGWLAEFLQVPVTMHKVDGEVPGNLRAVRLYRENGQIELSRTSKATAILRQPDQPDQVIPLVLRDRYDVLNEELRSLAPDPVYAATLKGGVPRVLASRGTVKFPEE